MNDDQPFSILDDVRDLVDPSDEERVQLREAVEELRARAFDAADDHDVELEAVTQTGSTARGTFVSGDRDIDLFLEFPSNTDTETLEQVGLAIGESILPDSQRDFAAHPYTKGVFKGFDVDVVPCFAVDDAANIQSAVDRTPFHTRFLEARLDDDFAADVRVAKKFLKGIGAYGSDVATGGFSGFLTELLVLEYGGFIPLLHSAVGWSFPVTPLNPGAWSADEIQQARQGGFEAPLVVIDPTDPGRNVAAALSKEKLGVFVVNARRFLDEPAQSFFEASPPSLSPGEAISRAERRGTSPLAVVINRPDDIVEDTFVPQLQKTLNGMVDALNNRDFDVFRSDVFVSDEAGALFLELSVATRPRVERHEGPPVDISAEEDFIDAHEDDDNVVGPFVEGGRLVVEQERDFQSAAAFIESNAVFETVSFGPAVERAFRANQQVFTGSALSVVSGRFPEQFSAYVDRSVVGDK